MGTSALAMPVFAIALALLGDAAAAEEAPSALVGTYSSSQPEVGAALRLDANGRFEYSLSYGALDETAQGTWTADGNGIVLTSDPVKAPIIQYLGYQGGKGSELVVSLDAPPQLPIQLFSAFLLQPNGTVSEVPFQDSSLHIPMTGATVPTKIAVAISVYQVTSPAYDISPAVGSLRFRFVPNDLGKVELDHHRLPWDSDGFDLDRLGLMIHFSKQAPEAATPSAAASN
jgi:hypothetical protein